MKLSLKQFNNLVKEAAIRKTHAREKVKEEAGNPPMPVEPALYESQRGNDENSQHDNDTEPGDPYIKRLKEAILRELNASGRILRKR